MISPHSYAMDSQNKAEELASTILSSSSPPKISFACTSIEAFLQKHSPDQSRFFFSIVFPTLICKIFGFDESSSQKSPSSGGWIDQIQASGDSEIAGRVFDLLSPSGVLISSINAVDRHSLVKYMFPVERLPEWARFMLQNERDCRVLSDLCPLFKGRIKDDSVKGSYRVQLNVFEYYMFWFAYYPVCRGNSESSDSVVVKKSRRFRLENWTSSLPVVGSVTRGLGHKNECSLYVRLLYAYLRAFVTDHSSNAHHPYRSSLLQYSSGYDGSVVMQAEFLVNTLIHFWLIDNDFSPLPVNVSRSFGVSFSFRAVLDETPPTSGLGEVVKLFVKYLMRSLVVTTEGFDPVESNGSPCWRVSGSVDTLKSRAPFSYGNSVGSWTSLVQRPLYRFVLRTFLFCPMETSIKNASRVFSLWLTYIEPWKIRLEDFSELDALVDQSDGNSRNENFQSPDKRDAFKDQCQSANGYVCHWQGFVLSNYLYYSSLVMHFLGFAHKFLHTDTETIIQMLSKVLNVLTSSRELIDLIRRVDAAVHSKPNGSSSPMIDNLQKYVPSIREQLQDWEDGLTESDADGSFLHENWNRDLQLFSDSEDGGHHLLQLLILRAESEIQAISGDNMPRNLQTLDSLKAQMCCLFGGNVGSTTPVAPELKQVQHTRDEIFKPRRVGNQTFANVKYKGDWMKRPVSDGEVAWLARLLVSLSDWLNEALRLTQGESSDAGPSWSHVDISGYESGKVGGLKEALRMALCSVGSCLLVLALAVVKFMKLHGLRVNLRVLASKKVVLVLIVSALFGALKKACGQYQFPHSEILLI